MLQPDYITRFKLGGPVKTFLGAVGRNTSIRPVSGQWGKKSDADAAAGASLGRWRECLDRLELYDYEFSAQKLLTCYNCAPCGVVYKPGSKFCNLAYLCPFCWGRSVQLAARALIVAVKSLPDKYLCDYNLTAFYCRRKLDIPRRQTLTGLRLHIQKALKAQRKLVGTVNQSGGYACVSVEPTPGNGWIVTNRGVFLGPEIGDAVYEDVFKLPTRHRAAAAPTSYDISRLISWAFRYPTGLLRCDVKRLVAYLSARKKLRLSATYGCLRNTLGVTPDTIPTKRDVHEAPAQAQEEDSRSCPIAESVLRGPAAATAR